MQILQKNYNIGYHTWYHIVSKASYFYEITNTDDRENLKSISMFAKDAGIDIIMISEWTNMLLARDYYDAVFIKNSLKWYHFDPLTLLLTVSSGEKIWDIADMLENQYKNPIWHRFIGLPGSIAWAVVGNAGCFGLETENNFVSAKVYNMLTGDTQILTKEDMQFSYRNSILKSSPHLFLLEATFDLSEVREKYSSTVDNIDFRNNKQPKWYCCGSFFKNPSKDVSAGMLIEQVGLKGHRVGWAFWSPLHANFLMSDGVTCTPNDLLSLVRFTQNTVKEKTGYDLINEVRILD